MHLVPPAYLSAIRRGLEAFFITTAAALFVIVIPLTTAISTCAVSSFGGAPGAPAATCDFPWPVLWRMILLAVVVGVLKTIAQFGENLHAAVTGPTLVESMPVGAPTDHTSLQTPIAGIPAPVKEQTS